MKHVINATLLATVLFCCCNKANAFAQRDANSFSDIPRFLNTVISWQAISSNMPTDMALDVGNQSHYDLNTNFLDNKYLGTQALPQSAHVSNLDALLVQLANTKTARTLSLDWSLNDNWKTQVKLQTVNGSAWLPLVSIPRFITQDSEDWTLAAVEVVYSF